MQVFSSCDKQGLIAVHGFLIVGFSCCGVQTLDAEAISGAKCSINNGISLRALEYRLKGCGRVA